MIRKHPSKIADLRAAANQERIWAASAMNEYEQEANRAKRASKRGYHVLASELRWDVRMCKLWHDMREKRAAHYERHIKALKR